MQGPCVKGFQLLEPLHTGRSCRDSVRSGACSQVPPPSSSLVPLLVVWLLLLLLWLVVLMMMVMVIVMDSWA